MRLSLHFVQGIPYHHFISSFHVSGYVRTNQCNALIIYTPKDHTIQFGKETRVKYSFKKHDSFGAVNYEQQNKYMEYQSDAWVRCLN